MMIPDKKQFNFRFNAISNPQINKSDNSQQSDASVYEFKIRKNGPDL